MRKGQVYLTDALQDWCRISGASLDWIICGELKGMAAAARAVRLLVGTVSTPTQKVPEGTVRIPILRNSAELDRHIAQRNAEDAKDISP